MVIYISFFNIILIAFSLSMDALTTSISNSLFNNSYIFIIKMSLTFGLFQFFMTLVGSLLGNFINTNIFIYRDLFSFIVFFILGLSILFGKESIDYINNIFSLLLIGFITSIDAFSVGITLSLYNKVLFYSIVIGLVTFTVCLIGSLFSSYLSKSFSYSNKIISGLLFLILSLYFLISYI